MPLFADSETLPIVNAVLTFLGTVFTGWMAYLVLKLNTKQKEAAVEVKEVKTTLHENTVKQDVHATQQDAKLDQGLKIQRATHTLVNFKTSKQLSTIRDDKRTIYELQPTDANRKALEVAERDLAEHLEQQEKVDAEYGAEATQMGTHPTQPNPK